MKKEYQCSQCKKIFYRYESQNPKFCSKQCKNEYQKTLIGELSHSYKGAFNIKHKCKYCNKTFKGHKSRIYCSLSCKSKDQDRSNIIYEREGKKNGNWKGNKMLKICPYCNKEFRAKRITQTYCDKECWKRDKSKFFKNGEAARLNLFIKNPSKPQIELYEIIKQIYPNCILNYPTESNFSIDIAIKKHMVAIEYDGSYWHNKEKDKIRQDKLENEGWKFIRYIYYIPNIKKIEEDLKDVIKYE